MIEKQRNYKLEAKIYGGVMTIMGLVPLLTTIRVSCIFPILMRVSIKDYVIGVCSQVHPLIIIIYGEFAVVGIALVVSGVGVLFLKKWSRKVAIIISALGLSFKLTIYVAALIFKIKIGFPLLYIMFYSILIYSLTRPKVKEQFK